MPLSLQQVVSALAERAGTSFCVVVPDGTRVCGGPGEPAFTLLFHTDMALASTFLRGHMGLLDAFFDQDVDLEGDLRAALAAGMQ
ncbi:MAG TPA: class I SAM-dependent methyltransferase, partial [Ramlibacter sp.]